MSSRGRAIKIYCFLYFNAAAIMFMITNYLCIIVFDNLLAGMSHPFVSGSFKSLMILSTHVGLPTICTRVVDVSACWMRYASNAWWLAPWLLGFIQKRIIISIHMILKHEHKIQTFQRGDRLYTSASDVCRRQMLTYKDGPRTGRIKYF